MQLLGNGDDGSEEDEADAILDDIREALALARRQGVLPPVRVTRILAGEGNFVRRTRRNEQAIDEPFPYL